MICVYLPDATDFTGNGIGPVAPSVCMVTETLNGEWEVYMEHPIDERGKWQRLVTGRIVRAPVPAAETPRIDGTAPAPGESREIYKVATPSGLSLRLRSGTGTKYKILGTYKQGSQVVVLSKSNASWYEVACKDGKRGYMYADYLTFVKTETTTVVGKGKVIEPRQLRDQPFRIYRVAPSLDGIKVYARHVFYDLADNMLRSYKPGKTDIGSTVVQQISAKCESEHDFTFHSDLTTTVEEVEFEAVNPIDALLDEGGVIEKYKAELMRDWYDVFVVERVGKATDVTIMEGKNLLGVTYDVDETDVVTRIMPTGEKKDGKLLYLDELYIDSPHINDYPHPKWYHLPVSEAKVDKDLTEAQAKTKMRAAAQDEYEKGCDMPVVTVTVDFVNAADTVEFAQYRALQNIFLGDTVSVIARRIGIAIAMRMTQYTFNCLTGMYDTIVLGVATEALEGTTISGKQLPNGEIRGGKLAPGSIGAGHLQDGSVRSLAIDAAAIGIAHIETAAIGALTAESITATRALIKQLATEEITTDELYAALAMIAVAQITTANIDAANIRWADIESLVAEMADIAVAEIGTADIDWARIKDLVAGTAIFTEGVGGELFIERLAVSDANIIGMSANKITAGTIDAAEIEVINLKAANITVGTINGQQIAPGAIDTGHIANGAITGSKIELGAIAANKLNLTQHTIW